MGAKIQQKSEAQHALRAIRPFRLRNRLESDLSFSHSYIKKDLKLFFGHAQKIANASALVDTGTSFEGNNDGNCFTSSSGNGSINGKNKGSNKKSGSPSADKVSRTNKDSLVCLWPPHHDCRMRKRLKDCCDCPKPRRESSSKEELPRSPKNGPATNTGSKAGEKGNTKQVVNDRKPKTGCLLKPTDASPKCSITLCDGEASMHEIGLCNDGSDHSLASPQSLRQRCLKESAA